MLSDKGGPVVTNPSADCLDPVYKQLKLDINDSVSKEHVLEAFKALGKQVQHHFSWYTWHTFILWQEQVQSFALMFFQRC